ncbi:P-loop containing nucleoside triphosphate hydrolase protein [Durotheca rogersii]|uniref:P-loop containing nucleoside triphosphate hydrolase protein n=1 Tax=Durotheca rogersii TaxID=419775 RepID=UPI00221F372F|nr:P-loop containing nucleoside triphosphate hydrolase protein [Durotheca rogersii]KAI5859879.1 P-loop containing nucleoside triphosphate hydrolase protein [Durotheca rogersii]
MVLEFIVSIDEIPPNYDDIVVSPDDIRKLENVTRMCLKRPKAFSYGLLERNRATGAIPHGPPGTGKSSLAKGLARQLEFNMLSISTADLWQKYWGVSEKVIKAVFSMARKLKPHIRGMVNQFLLEWDGLVTGKHSPFILLATNRPFDLDPAVRRRAPIQVLLDVPVYSELVRCMHRYTSSDLENLCVQAAVTCVAEQEEDQETRVLCWRHFSSAMETVKPTTLSSEMRDEL